MGKRKREEKSQVEHLERASEIMPEPDHGKQDASTAARFAQWRATSRILASVKAMYGVK